MGRLTLLIDLGALTAFRFKNDNYRLTSIVLGLIFFVTVIVRMDAILQLFIIGIYLVSRGNFNVRRTALPLLILLLTAAAILWLQRAYFGDFLPNTYYQKVVGASAWERIKNGILVFNQYTTRDVLMLALFSLAGVIFYKELQN